MTVCTNGRPRRDPATDPATEAAAEGAVMMWGRCVTGEGEIKRNISVEIGRGG